MEGRLKIRWIFEHTYHLFNSGIQLEAKKSAPETRGRTAIVSIPSKELQSELAKGTQGKEKLNKEYRRQTGPCDPTENKAQYTGCPSSLSCFLHRPA